MAELAIGMLVCLMLVALVLCFMRGAGILKRED